MINLFEVINISLYLILIYEKSNNIRHQLNIGSSQSLIQSETCLKVVLEILPANN